MLRMLSLTAIQRVTYELIIREHLLRTMLLVALGCEGVVQPVLLGEAVQQLHLLLWGHLLKKIVHASQLGR